LHGGVCDNGVCEFRCSDYAGYTCQNASSLLPSLSICADVLTMSSPGDAVEDIGQHCAPSEHSILQQLESVVVVPNYNRLMPGGRTLFSILDNGYCVATAKRLACWVSLIPLCSLSLSTYRLSVTLHNLVETLQISIQRCDRDGDNRLRVCHSACRSYNAACGAGLDCSDQTLFSSEEEGDGQCTGYGDIKPWWFRRFRTIYSQ
jgi:leishmanolysin